MIDAQTIDALRAWVLADAPDAATTNNVRTILVPRLLVAHVRLSAAVGEMEDLCRDKFSSDAVTRSGAGVI